MTTEITLKIGNYYNWKYQPERLVYLGKNGMWHQFAERSKPRDVWCECLDSDLELIEETKE